MTAELVRCFPKNVNNCAYGSNEWSYLEAKGLLKSTTQQRLGGGGDMFLASRYQEIMSHNKDSPITGKYEDFLFRTRVKSIE